EGADPRQVALERQRHEVGQEADVLLIVLRHAARLLDARRGLGVAALDAGQAHLDLADAAEVLVELALVVAAELVTQRLGVVGDEVEDAAVVLLALGPGRLALALAAAAEEPLEDRPRVDLLAHRRRLGAPGDVRRVDAAVAGVAVAGLPAALAAELQ